MSLVEEALSRKWYHTMELAPGVVTDGFYDLRPYVNRFGIPERLDGIRALDVGTFDGFWAFELERRGATVVGIDIDHEQDLDWPPRRRPSTFSPEPRGHRFTIARELLGSKVERVGVSIYHARREDLGTFDFVFCGSVILHLRDQLLALERIAGLCTGQFISVEEYDRIAGLSPVPVARYLADRASAPVFWLPSARTWRRMIWTAGFDQVTERSRLKLYAPGGTTYVRHVVHHARK